MKALWRDVILAAMLGFVLPWLALRVGILYAGGTAQPVAQVTRQTSVSSVPMLTLNTERGRECLELETYLVGVVLAEMPAQFPSEALKAQAVAARTYARKAQQDKKHEDGSLCGSSLCCQGYTDPEAYVAQGGSLELLEKVQCAVKETEGLCLTYNGSLIEATYFSSSNGQTEAALAVWGTDYPYLISVESPETAQAQTETFSLQAFSEALGQKLSGEPGQWIGEIRYTQGGGVESIEIGGMRYSGTHLRSLLGLRSTDFEIHAEEDWICVTTRGYGHRVGMSQYGAEAMAEQGTTFDQILAHYYPGTKLETQETYIDNQEVSR